MLGNFKLPKTLVTNRKIVIVIAAWNEAKNIEETIQSIFKTISSENIEKVVVGDDGSKDSTLYILEGLMERFPNLVVERFQRLGKPSIINKIMKTYGFNTEQYNVVFMDANISVHENCFEELEGLLYRQGVGMVGASICPKNSQPNVESDYILRENRIKYHESAAVGYVVGVFGGCYMIKGESFRSTPKNYVTDDLFQTFQIIEQGQHILFSKTGYASEEISAIVENEFNRKRRYAAGNFQILLRFWNLLLMPKESSLGFKYCYFFHKIIRWVSPIVFSLFWILSLFEFFGSYSVFIFCLGAMIFVFLLINYFLQKSTKFILAKRYYYFLCMNIAIVLGFLDFIKGIQTNVWERSERN